MPFTQWTVLNPKRGGNIKDGVVIETPFTVKGRSMTLPNVTDELRAAYVWSVHPPDNSKFQRDFDSKIEKII